MYLDIEFATRIMGSLPQSEIVRRGGEFSIHSRCPICGDSMKDKHKNVSGYSRQNEAHT